MIYRNLFVMEKNDTETNQGEDTLLPSPKFVSRPVYMGRIICQICFASSSIIKFWKIYRLCTKAEAI